MLLTFNCLFALQYKNNIYVQLIKLCLAKSVLQPDNICHVIIECGNHRLALLLKKSPNSFALYLTFLGLSGMCSPLPEPYTTGRAPGSWLLEAGCHRCTPQLQGSQWQQCGFLLFLFCRCYVNLLCRRCAVTLQGRRGDAGACSFPSPTEMRMDVHNDPSYLCKLNLNRENSCLPLILEKNRHL